MRTAIRFAWCVLGFTFSGVAFGGEAGDALDFSDVGVYGTCFDFCDFSVFKARYAGKTARPEALKGLAERLRSTSAAGKRNLLGLYTFDRVKYSRPLDEYRADTDAVLSALDLADVYAVFLSEENVTWNNGMKVLNGLYDHIKARYPQLQVYQWLTSPDGPHPKLKADGWVFDFYGAPKARFRRKMVEYVLTGKPFVMCLNASPDVSRFADSGGEAISQGQLEVCREFNIPVFYYCVDLKWGSPAIWHHSNSDTIVPWRQWVLEAVHGSHHTDTSILPALSAQYSSGKPIEVAGDESGNVVFDETFADLGLVRHASIRGLLNVNWDGLGERVVIRRRAGDFPRAELIYHFVSDFQLSGLSATLTGRTLHADSAPIEVAVSVTGHDWPLHARAPAGVTGDEPFRVVASAEGNENMQGKAVWVRVLADAGGVDVREATAVLESLRLTCRATPPERREIVLEPDRRGNVAYRDTFDSQKYLHLAHITNGKELTWKRGAVGTHGVKGRGNRVDLRWKVVCERPLKDLRVRMTCSGNRKNLGAVTVLGVSLDGKNLLREESSADKPANSQGTFSGELLIHSADLPELQGVREFWVHGIMRNGTGIKTNTSNTISELLVEGVAEKK